MVSDADQNINSLPTSLFYFLPSLWVVNGSDALCPTSNFLESLSIEVGHSPGKKKSPLVCAHVKVYGSQGGMRKVRTPCVRCPKHTGDLYPSLVPF